MDRRSWGNVKAHLILSIYIRHLELRWHFDNTFTHAHPVRRKKYKINCLYFFWMSKVTRHLRSNLDFPHTQMFGYIRLFVRGIFLILNFLFRDMIFKNNFIMDPKAPLTFLWVYMIRIKQVNNSFGSFLLFVRLSVCPCVLGCDILVILENFCTFLSFGFCSPSVRGVGKPPKNFTSIVIFSQLCKPISTIKGIFTKTTTMLEVRPVIR